MTLLDDTCSRIKDVDCDAAEAIQAQLDGKTKPRRSLGRLEDLAVTMASIRGRNLPCETRKAIVVMAADHGVAAEGVSAYPQEVTRQMLLNFAKGGAAICVLARMVGARLVVVDMGVKEALPPTPEVRVHRIGPGTVSITCGPAMTSEQAIASIEAGISIATELANDGITLLGIGEMGIGNTTSASAIASVLLGIQPREAAGRGTGIDDAGLQRKIDAITRAIALNRPDPRDALDTLTKLGGFEIGGLAGVALGAAAGSVAVVVEGLIASTAALVAARIEPRIIDYLLPSHRSVEVAHQKVLDALHLTPLLHLDMRLGEGTGAALCMPLVDAALRILHEMATFQAAGVSDSGA